MAEEPQHYDGALATTLLDHAPLGVFVVDSDFRIRQLNPSAQQVFGEVPGGLVERDFDEVMHLICEKAFADEVVRIFRVALETGEYFVAPESAAFRIDLRATEYFEWRVDRITLPDKSYGLVCYFRDITDHVAARTTVADVEEHNRRAALGLRAIASRARCLLWYADVEDRGGLTLDWNVRMADDEAARRFLPVEAPPDHGYAEALSEARLPEDRERMAWGDEETRAGRSYRQEFRVRDAAGSVRWMVEDVQIEATGPKSWHAVGITVDITERKRAEEEREKHRAEIEALNYRLQRAMAETHHRVKNNLQVISALVDIQTMLHEYDVPAREMARIGQHIRALAAIHDLLTHNAKSNGTSDSVLTGQVMDKLAPLLNSVVGDRDITFHVEDIPLAVRQGTSLAVLVNELVSNAVKHGKGKIEVSLAVADDRVRLAVSDEGPGFCEQFDPIKTRNTGLELIESVGRHDLLGTILYENRLEGGARVIVDFPRPRVDC